MMDIGDGRAAGRGTLLFLIIAFGWSWAWGFAIWLAGGVAGSSFLLLAMVFMAGPMIAAIVCAILYDKGRRIAALGLKPRLTASAWLWLFLAWAIPLLLVVGATLIDWAGPPAPQDPAVPLGAALRAQGLDPDTLPAGMTVIVISQIAGALTIAPLLNMFGTLTEELGWRGWLWARWRPMGFWRCNLLIGAVWGVWHAPIIVQGYNYPGMPLWGPVLMTLFCILLAPLIGIVREKGGSVWHAALFHGTINATVGVGLMVSTPIDFPWRGMLGIGGAATCLVGWAAILLLWRREPDRNVTSFA